MSEWFSDYGDRVFDFLGFVDKGTECIAGFLQQTFMLIFMVIILVLFLLPVGIADYAVCRIKNRIEKRFTR